MIARQLPPLLWLLSALTMVSGYYVVNAHFERAIAQSVARSEKLYDQTVSNERAIANSGKLLSLQRRVDHDLRVFDGQNYARSSEGLLQLLQSDGERFSTNVTGVEPVQAPAASQSTSTVFGLNGIGLTIRARGSFVQLLHFIADLPEHDVLLAVSDSELRSVQSATPGGRPIVEATIHATQYTLYTTPEQHAVNQ